jgi:hypothetical protein
MKNNIKVELEPFQNLTIKVKIKINKKIWWILQKIVHLNFHFNKNKEHKKTMIFLKIIIKNKQKKEEAVKYWKRV